MLRTLLAMMILASVTQSGCAFLGGAAVGATAVGAGVELNNKAQMDRLEADYRNERITRQEYEARKEQIQRGSLIY